MKKYIIIAILCTTLLLAVGGLMYVLKIHTVPTITVDEQKPVSTTTAQEQEDKIAYLDKRSGKLIPLDMNDLRKVGHYYYLDDRAQKIYYLEKVLNENSFQLRDALITDFNDFSVYEKDNRYAHNSTNVYAVFHIPWSENFEFGVIEKANPLTFEPKIVERFDVSQGNTFQGWISKDKNYVYYRYDVFENADPESFIISENVSINKDKNNVYLWREILPKADPETYEILLDESEGKRGTVYGKDKNNFFIDYCMVSGVDMYSFNNEGRKFSDKNGVFIIDYSAEQNTCSINRK